MAKWIKKLLGLAAIGGAVAGLVYYFKNKNADADDFEDDFEDEDFDLDSDLKPADREYVSLTPAKDGSDEAAVKEEDTQEVPAEDAVEAEEAPAVADAEEAEKAEENAAEETEVKEEATCDK